MNEFNKVSIRQGAIVLTIAVVIFFTSVVFLKAFKSVSSILLFIPTTVAVAYACKTFAKKYWISDKNEH